MLRQGCHICGIYSLALVACISACKPKAPDDPTATGKAGLELEAMTLPGAGKELRWLGGDTTASLTVLFNQGMSSPIVQASKCPTDPTTWKELPDKLAVTHNTLTKPGELSREPGSMDWISIPEVMPVTRVSYSRNSSSAGMDFGLQYFTAVQLDAGFDVQKEDLSLVVADVTKAVELKATGCVLQNLCSERGEGGSYVDAVYYGSMLRLYVDSSAYSVEVGGSGGTSTVKIRFKAGLDKSRLQLRGGLIGSFAGDQVGRVVKIDDVLAAVEKRDLFALQGIMRTASTLGVIAVRVAQYSKSDCAALAAPAQPPAPGKEGQG